LFAPIIQNTGSGVCMDKISCATCLTAARRWPNWAQDAGVAQW
jgi:hypothetical protein